MNRKRIMAFLLVLLMGLQMPVQIYAETAEQTTAGGTTSAADETEASGEAISGQTGAVTETGDQSPASGETLSDQQESADGETLTGETGEQTDETAAQTGEQADETDPAADETGTAGETEETEELADILPAETGDGQTEILPGGTQTLTYTIKWNDNTGSTASDTTNAADRPSIDSFDALALYCRVDSGEWVLLTEEICQSIGLETMPTVAPTQSGNNWTYTIAGMPTSYTERVWTYPEDESEEEATYTDTTHTVSYDLRPVF